MWALTWDTAVVAGATLILSLTGAPTLINVRVQWHCNNVIYTETCLLLLLVFVLVRIIAAPPSSKSSERFPIKNIDCE